MAGLAYSIQSPVRSFTNPSSKIKLCRSYGCFAMVPKPAEEKGLLRGSGSRLVPKSSNLGFGLHASSMGFRKCSISSRVKGGDGDFVRITKDLIFMLVHSLCVKGGDGAFVRITKNLIFIVAMVAITTFAAGTSASPAWRRAVFIGAVIAFFAKAIFERRHRQPFSLGDTIRVGSLEGQVVEMRLNTTSLLSAGTFPIEFTNSLLSSLLVYAIVNLSQAHRRGLVITIRIYTGDHAKVPLICDDIEKMISSNRMIFLEKEPPYCYLSNLEEGHVFVLTLKCTLKDMSKGAIYSARQVIIVQAADLIKRHGATFISWISVKANLNLSRAHGRHVVTTIRFHTDDFAKVPLICDGIEKMLSSNPMIFLEEGPPYCYLSKILGSELEFTLECTLKEMSKSQFYSAEQYILLQVNDLFKSHPFCGYRKKVQS